MTQWVEVEPNEFELKLSGVLKIEVYPSKTFWKWHIYGFTCQMKGRADRLIDAQNQALDSLQSMLNGLRRQVRNSYISEYTEPQP